MVVDLSLHAIGFCFLLKLTTSLDDVIWLSPFLARAPLERTSFQAIYISVCLSVTIAAFAAATFTKHVMDSYLSGWFDAERLLSVLAFVGLSILAFRDYKEWREEREAENNLILESNLPEIELCPSASNPQLPDPDSEIKSKSKSSKPSSAPTSVSSAYDFAPIATVQTSSSSLFSISPSSSSVSSNQPDTVSDGENEFTHYRRPANHTGPDNNIADLNDNGVDNNVNNEHNSTSAVVNNNHHTPETRPFVNFLFVVILGTLDDMIVFVSCISGTSGATEITFPSLLIGAGAAIAVILSFSTFIAQVPWFQRVVEKLPMWCLLMAIALYVLVLGLVKG
ncbi:hypothetical protein TrVE_jg8580 [Triparma verrucosa]|uniref:Uncharacterized protein n=1 Tax=Triparma verrucosa TaxID=1606542 RepID=A0A9W7FGH0_9STRA|nr:hypothetical protein TrVE_jg8580 [Triparma verrucosa]